MKMIKCFSLCVVLMLLLAGPVLAEVPNSVTFSGAGLGAGLGMALTIIGAGYGLARIGSSALDAMARQPEVAPRVQTAMIIIAAMLEGATLASVILCFLIGNKATF